MPAILCSQKLRKRIAPGRTLAPLDELPSGADCQLGNWGATTVTLYRRPHVLFVNEKTLLCVLVTLSPAKTLFARFAKALRRELERIWVDVPTIQAEVVALERVAVARNSNRSLVGYLNELVFQVQVIAEHSPLDGGEPDYAAIHAELNDIPHVKRNPSFAVDAVRELFGLPKLERRLLPRVDTDTVH